MPRCFRSRIRPEIGLSTARQSGSCVFMSPCASQAPLPPPAWQIWMKRTSVFHQAARQQELLAEIVGFLFADAVERLSRCFGSLEKSTTAGAVSCIRAASS